MYLHKVHQASVGIPQQHYGDVICAEITHKSNLVSKSTLSIKQQLSSGTCGLTAARSNTQPFNIQCLQCKSNLGTTCM